MEQQLNEAARYGGDEVIEAILRDHPDVDVNWRDGKHAWTALHHASLFSHIEVVKLLLAHPTINGNVSEESGRTPLSFGCESGRVSVVKLLKEPHIDVKLADNDDRTPLSWTSYNRHHDVIE